MPATRPTTQTAPLGAAIALFARDPVTGRTKSRLAASVGEPAAATLAEAFLRDTAQAVTSSEAWTPLLYVDPPGRAAALATELGFAPTAGRAQARGHIGLRMHAAATELFATGFAPVVIVGSDVPMLDRGRLHQALRALRRAQVVWGPAEDGGYYLVGMWEPRPALFDDPTLRWGEGDVLATSERIARGIGLTTGRIGTELDIDSGGDLDRLRERLATLELAGGMTPPTLAQHTAAALRALDSATDHDHDRGISGG